MQYLDISLVLLTTSVTDEVTSCCVDITSKHLHCLHPHHCKQLPIYLTHLIKPHHEGQLKDAYFQNLNTFYAVENVYRPP